MLHGPMQAAGRASPASSVRSCSRNACGSVCKTPPSLHGWGQRPRAPGAQARERRPPMWCLLCLALQSTSRWVALGGVLGCCTHSLFEVTGLRGCLPLGTVLSHMHVSAALHCAASPEHGSAHPCTSRAPNLPQLSGFSCCSRVNVYNLLLPGRH